MDDVVEFEVWDEEALVVAVVDSGVVGLERGVLFHQMLHLQCILCKCMGVLHSFCWWIEWLGHTRCAGIVCWYKLWMLPFEWVCQVIKGSGC